MARPKIEIDEEQVEKLSAINCSHEEMGSILGCSADTLERRFAAAIKRGRNEGRTSLKRKQFEIAMSGNVIMLIWLGKQLLGQKDISRVDLSEIPDQIFMEEAGRRFRLLPNYDPATDNIKDEVTVT